MLGRVKVAIVSALFSITRMYVAVSHNQEKTAKYILTNLAVLYNLSYRKRDLWIVSSLNKTFRAIEATFMKIKVKQSAFYLIHY